jgi:amino acid adenylation domain-containing protein
MPTDQISAPSDHSWRAGDDFAAAAAAFPNRAALRVDGQSYSYGQLKQTVDGFVGALQSAPRAAPVTAIYADRSLEAYAGVLAALICGHAYVPLNPKFPDTRNQLIVERSEASTLIASPRAQARVQAILALDARMDAPALISAQDMAPAAAGPAQADNPYAYILFTSGSTGVPKGVAIRHTNLSAYLDATFAVTDYRHTDRFSQNFDLTFDLSVHDMFVCWRAGGELIVPSETDLENPAQYVLRQGVTCWFSVPSLAQKMNLRSTLTPEMLGGLRISLFCGETLPMDLALKWQGATGQVVENWYGPTEATIACTRYVLPPAGSPVAGRFGLAPIGQGLPGMKTLVLTESGAHAALGDMGELLVTGPQLADGYLNDGEKTAAAFVDLPEFGGRYYRTGDRVLLDEHGQLLFVDRIDNQIKIRGYRVELGEIEAKIRDLVDGCSVIVTPLPLKSPTPTALLASVEGWQGDTRAVLDALGTSLPDYMVPTDLRVMDHFPKNASGKIDRGAIGTLVTTARPASDDPSTDQPQRVRKAVIEMVQRINPAITRDRILQSPDLMDAGLDSLAFTEFTLDLEKAFGIPLDQMLVARMSEMSIQNLVPLIKRKMQNIPMARKGGAGRRGTAAIAKAGGGKGKAGKAGVKTSSKTGKDRKKTLHYRARRTVECVDHFPAFVAAAPHPLAIFIGSSGMMSGAVAPVIAARAAELGFPVTAANMGMAKLSNAGTTELAQFIRDTVRAAGKKIAFVMYELELMQLSTLPSGRDIEVVRDYLDGVYTVESLPSLDPNNIWDPATGGTIGLKAGKTLADPDEIEAAEPDWMKKRATEVLDTYLGKTEMAAAEADIWLQGVAAMKEVSDHVIGFVHPLNAEGVAAARAADPNNHFDTLIQDLETRGKIQILPHEDFQFDPEDFRDKNHVNKSKGAKTMSLQMTEAVVNILKNGY